METDEEFWATQGGLTGPAPELDDDVVETMQEDDGKDYEEFVFFEKGKLVTVRRPKRK